MPTITLRNGEVVELPYGTDGGEPAWMDLMRRDLLGLEQPPPAPEMPIMAPLGTSETPLGQGPPSPLPTGLAPFEAPGGPPQVHVAPPVGGPPSGRVNAPYVMGSAPEVSSEGRPHILGSTPEIERVNAATGPASAPEGEAMVSRPTSPEGAIELATQVGLRGLQATGQAKADQADAIAAGKARMARTMGDQIIEREKAARESEQELRQFQARLDTERQAIMNAVPDQKRFWKNASTASKIGMALQVIGSGLTRRGTPNEGLEMMKGIMNRDLQAQVAEVENKKYGLEQGFNLYRLNLQRLKDKQAAIKETQAMQLQQGAMQLEAEADKYNSQIIKGEYAQTAAQMRAEAEKAKLEATGKVWDIKKTQEMIRASKSRTGLDWARFKWEKSEAEKARKGKGIDLASASVADGLVFVDPQGNTASPTQDIPIMFPEPKDRRDAIEKVEAANNILDALHMIKELGVERATPGIDADRQQQIDSEIAYAMKQIVENGPRISDNDAKWYERSIQGDLTKFIKLGDEKQRERLINMAIKRFEDSTDRSMRGYATGRSGVNYGYRYKPGRRVEQFKAERQDKERTKKVEELKSEFKRETGKDFNTEYSRWLNDGGIPRGMTPEQQERYIQAREAKGLPITGETFEERTEELASKTESQLLKQGPIKYFLNQGKE